MGNFAFMAKSWRVVSRLIAVIAVVVTVANVAVAKEKAAAGVIKGTVYDPCALIYVKDDFYAVAQNGKLYPIKIRYKGKFEVKNLPLGKYSIAYYDKDNSYQLVIVERDIEVKLERKAKVYISDVYQCTI